MKLRAVQKQNSGSFEGALNNKTFLKGLEYAGGHNALVAGGAALLMSAFVRPLAILSTPETSKKDKQYACAKSIASGVVGFGLTASVFAPISKALDKIAKSPVDFLKEDTVKNLKRSAETLKEAAPYNFMEQTIKMSSEFISVIPKAFLTCALVVPLAQKLFKKEEKEKDLSFKGLSGGVKIVAGVINEEKFQKFALKHQNADFIQHAICLKDVFATACFAFATFLNPKIKKEDKNPLVKNATISTGLTIAGGYAVKEGLRKPMDKFIKAFKTINKNDPKLYKYLNGIKVLEPIIILSGLYYVAIPILSTFFSGRVEKR